ncbi:MAG: hypothetical protein IEMM0008_1619 [bacterium]|nr:MAG: hypothetical protein IEMM0008_1619 [bacterium]
MGLIFFHKILIIAGILFCGYLAYWEYGKYDEPNLPYTIAASRFEEDIVKNIEKVDRDYLLSYYTANSSNPKDRNAGKSYTLKKSMNPKGRLKLKTILKASGYFNEPLFITIASLVVLAGLIGYYFYLTQHYQKE